jgi:hypothetical protein
MIGSNWRVLRGVCRAWDGEDSGFGRKVRQQSASSLQGCFVIAAGAIEISSKRLPLHHGSPVRSIVEN